MATGTSFSSYFEAQILNWIKGTNIAAAPATLYLALYTANPNDASASGTEVAGNGYARIGVTSASGWSAVSDAGAGTGATISNASLVTFATPTGPGWGTVTAFAVYDALTSGNEIVWALLQFSKVINGGDTVTFPPATLVITVD